MIIFKKLTRADKKSLRAINHLLPQLSASAKRLSYRDLGGIARDKNNVFLVLHDGEKIIGMGLTVFIHTPRGLRARIEDLVIDQQHRRRGLGNMLVRRLVAEAKKRRVLWAELTSRRDRAETEIFYKKLGFRPRDTNVYRLSL